jgi:phospholipid/cholesterol/gamma-HCH transport system substrate-binding protein
MRPSDYLWSRIRVGLFIAMSGIVLFAAVFYFGITGSSLGHRAEVHADFDDVFGLAQGSPVEMGGVVIGQVEKLGLPLVESGLVPVTLAIDPSALQRMSESSVAFTSSHALVGQRFVGVTVRHAKETPLAPGGSIRTRRAESMETVSDKAVAVLNQIDKLLQTVRVIADNSGEIVADIQQGHGILGQLVHDEGLSADLRKGIQSFSKTAQSINEGHGLLGRLTNDEADAEKFDHALANVDAVAGQLASARGTLGALISDPAVLEHITTLLNQADSLVADLRRNPQRYLKIQAF